MPLWQNPQFGAMVITLMAALMLVLQILMVAQRGLVTNIRAFSVQSLLLGSIAATIAHFEHAAPIYLAAAILAGLKGVVVPLILERLVERVGIAHEIEPILNAPTAVLTCGVLTGVAYTVAQSFHRNGPVGLGQNTLAAAIAIFLIGFFMVVNRRKAISQVLGLLCLENGVFLAAVSLTYGMPLIIDLGIFFDLLVAVLVLAILIHHIGRSFDSIDVSRLRRLRG